MRNLKIIEHISLDGVIQHSADENGFAHTDWTAPYRTAEGGAKVMAAHGDEFDLLLGRRTYDMWATMWGQAPSNPVGDRINAATKYVATHRPDSLGAMREIHGVGDAKLERYGSAFLEVIQNSTR